MVLAKYIAVVLVTLSAHAFAQLSRLPDRTDDRTEIMLSIAEISRAYVARNPEPFERIYLENYVSIRGKPVYNTREQLIAMMKADSGPVRAGKKLDYETISYESENPQFHFYGQAAIVNIFKKNFWQYRGIKCLTRTQATELWSKRNGEWQLAGAHVTTFQCEAKPFHPIHPAAAAIPSITKAPANSDPEAESQIRAVVGEIANARLSGSVSFAAALEKNSVKDFVATNINGEVLRDRSLLSSLPQPTSGRIPGLRNQDDAIQIFGDAAILTFRVKAAAPKPGTAPESPQQCTIILVNVQGKWLIAATHVSKIASD